MLRWSIGAVTITRVVELEMPVAYHERHPFIAQARPEVLRATPWLFPNFVTPEGHLILSFHALLVEAPGVRLVIDTCIGNDKPRNMLGKVPLQTTFLQQLSDLGWSRESVDAVVCTHLHVDHVGWNTMRAGDGWVPTFPNARYLIGRREFDHWSAHGDEEQQAILSDSVKPIFDAGLVDLVEMDHRISPELRLTPTPGHTPGHVSVVIESRGETAMISGDAIHHPCQMAHPDWSPSFDSDQRASVVTRRAMLEDVAERPILFIGTHFPAPTAGRVRRDGDGYRLVD
jgi:glyoxylase-like metal-dependent hydrolase (beta-lactamase superfamily II)